MQEKLLNIFVTFSRSTKAFMRLEFQEWWYLVLLGEVFNQLILKLLKISVVLDVLCPWGLQPLKLLLQESLIWAIKTTK